MAKKEYKTTFNQLVNDMLSGKTFYDLIDWKRFVQKESTVFIVVDAQNDIVHKDGNLNWTGTWKVAEELGLVKNIKNIVAACRKKEIPVIWVRQTFLAGGKDLFPGSYFEALINFLRTAIPDLMLGDTWNIDIVDDLKAVMEPKDLIIDKRLWSTFEGTNLQTYLHYLGTKTIIVCGCEIDQCVEATVRSGWDRGYLSVLVSDASATANMETTKLACQRMGLMMAPVISSNQVVDLINNL